MGVGFKDILLLLRQVELFSLNLLENWFRSSWGQTFSLWYIMRFDQKLFAVFLVFMTSVANEYSKKMYFYAKLLQMLAHSTI